MQPVVIEVESRRLIAFYALRVHSPIRKDKRLVQVLVLQELRRLVLETPWSVIVICAKLAMALQRRVLLQTTTVRFAQSVVIEMEWRRLIAFYVKLEARQLVLARQQPVIVICAKLAMAR